MNYYLVRHETDKEDVVIKVEMTKQQAEEEIAKEVKLSQTLKSKISYSMTEVKDISSWTTMGKLVK